MCQNMVSVQQKAPKFLSRCECLYITLLPVPKNSIPYVSKRECATLIYTFNILEEKNSPRNQGIQIFFQKIQIYFSFSKSSLLVLLLIPRITDTELVMTFVGFFLSMYKMSDSVLNSGHHIDHVQDKTSPRNDFSFV
jgi:hypothetical protein